MPPRSKSPAKSPAKARTASPTPTRTTPRKTAGAAPSRLGGDDGWGTGSATKWVSDTVRTSAEREEAKAKERTEYIAEYNQKIDQSADKSLLDRYSEVMATYKWPATIIQTAVLSMLGSIVAQAIKGASLLDGLSVWGTWGAIVAVLSLPYLGWLNKTTFVKQSKRGEIVAKAGFNQAFFVPFLNMMFLSYFAMLKGDDAVTKITTELPELTVKSFLLWFPSDLINMSMMPPEYQMLWNSSISVAWTAYLALMG